MQWRVALDEALAGRTLRIRCCRRSTIRWRATGSRTQLLPRNDRRRSSDLEPRRFETFDQLYRYCYQVASVVGLTTIHIFGFESPEALPLAEKCGIAFQLTNILRDIREDAERGRIYLPAEDLARFGVREQDLRAGLRTPEFIELMDFEAARARTYYQESQPLIGLVDRRSRASLGALITIYSRLLDRIERSNYDVFTRRISLSAWEKSVIVARGLLKLPVRSPGVPICPSRPPGRAPRRSAT